MRVGRQWHSLLVTSPVPAQGCCIYISRATAAWKLVFQSQVVVAYKSTHPHYILPATHLHRSILASSRHLSHIRSSRHQTTWTLSRAYKAIIIYQSIVPAHTTSAAFPSSAAMSFRIAPLLRQRLFTTSTRARTTVPIENLAAAELTAATSTVPRLGRTTRWYAFCPLIMK
jgi:hypothetical protein